MSEPIQVIKIDPSGRYVLLLEERVPLAQLERMSIILRDWWNSHEPFIIINAGGDMRFERVDNDVS